MYGPSDEHIKAAVIVLVGTGILIGAALAALVWWIAT